MSYTNIAGVDKQGIIEQINYRQDQERKAQLDQYLERLNALGFYVELLPSIEPLFFVEKQGFSIKEALLLTRGRQQTRPNNEEIQRLQTDKESNILKLEYENIAFQEDQSYTYIIILGPPNRGKTTFIFNIINKIFNVQYYSLYRVKKQQDETRRYYDEYCIQMQNKNYVFVDFRGIGDSKLDFLGLDYSGNSNIYIEILKYIQNKALAAIFYVNSSSINRLSEDESYCLQRFFELIPQTIINQNKFFLVLTYCTDNQPKMTIYEQSNSTPEGLKDLLKDSNLSDEKRFWYGINNKPLYEPVIYFDGQNQVQNQEIDKLIKKIGEDVFLEPEMNLNDGNFLGSEERNEDEDQQIQDQPEIKEEQLGKYQFNLMSKIIEEIIQKLQLFNNCQDNDAINNSMYFKNKLNFEKNIIELLIIYRLSTEGLAIQELKVQEFQTTYLGYVLRDSNETETLKIRQGSKLLQCKQCNIQCHANCRFNNTSEMVENNMCRMFIQRNGIFECKKCNKQSNKQCNPQDHILIDRNLEIPKKIQVQMIISQNYDQFKTNISLNKKLKALDRLQQTAAIKAKVNYQTKIDEIRSLMENNNEDNDCIAVDLHQRAKYLNAMMTQLKQNNQNGDDFYKKLEEVNQIYQNLNQIKTTQVQQQQEQANTMAREQQQQVNIEPEVVQQQENIEPEVVQQQENIEPELNMEDQNVSQINNNIYFRQQSLDQNLINHQNQFSQQIINGSPLRNNLVISSLFCANEQQPLMSHQ